MNNTLKWKCHCDNFLYGCIRSFPLKALGGANGNNFYPLTFQAEWVLSLPVSVPPSIRLPVYELYFVRMLTRDRLELGSPNLLQTCILGYSRLLLKIEVNDLDIQGHFDLEF